MRLPSPRLGSAEEKTTLPDVQPTQTGTGRSCARVSPSTSNPHHPRPWHRGSLFGDGPRRPLSADERRAWLARAEGERRAGRLTALYVEVGRALLRRLSADGQCDPAHATVAADAGCGERTVRRALATLRQAGLLAWEQRLVRRSWPAGGRGAQRAEQTSNAYLFTVPVGPITPPLPRPVRQRRLPLPHCGGQAGRETPSQYASGAFVMPSEEELAQVRSLKAARTARLEAEWLAQRAERWCMRG